MSIAARRVFVVGGRTLPFIGKGHPDFIHKKHPEFGKRENPSLREYITNGVKGCLEETRVPGDLIEKTFVGNFCGELFSNQGHLGAAVSDDTGLEDMASMRVEGACASGGLAFAAGVDSIKAGADFVLVLGAEVQTTKSPKEGGDFLARAADYERERAIDPFTFPALFAQRMQAVKQNCTSISDKAYSNARKNPLAHMHHSKADASSGVNFLSNEELNPYLSTYDCSQVTDGSSALILASERGLEKLKTIAPPEEVNPMECLTSRICTGNLWHAPLSLTKFDTTAKAAARAYQDTGLKPSDIEVAEVHDCFNVAEVLMYEALGFASYGEGARLCDEGHTAIDGRIPVNTGGGLIGMGHPVGATGVKQIVEVWRQMKGKCGQYQIGRAVNVGLTANMGGNDKTAVVSIFRNC